jgi:hypothetical protein
MSDRVVLERFQGFTDGALDGYAADVAARRIGGPAEANLRALPPLDRELSIEVDGERAVFHDGETGVSLQLLADPLLERVQLRPRRRALRPRRRVALDRAGDRVATRPRQPDSSRAASRSAWRRSGDSGTRLFQPAGDAWIEGSRGALGLLDQPQDVSEADEVHRHVSGVLRHPFLGIERVIEEGNDRPIRERRRSADLVRYIERRSQQTIGVATGIEPLGHAAHRNRTSPSPPKAVPSDGRPNSRVPCNEPAGNVPWVPAHESPMVIRQRESLEEDACLDEPCARDGTPTAPETSRGSQPKS